MWSPTFTIKICLLTAKDLISKVLMLAILFPNYPSQSGHFSQNTKQIHYALKQCAWQSSLLITVLILSVEVAGYHHWVIRHQYSQTISTRLSHIILAPLKIKTLFSSAHSSNTFPSLQLKYDQGWYLGIILQHGCQGLCPFRDGMKNIALSLRCIG